MNIRKKTYQILEKHTGGRLGFSINLFLVVLIISSVISVILESDKDLANQYENGFYYFEFFAFSLFSIDYLLRVWIAPEATNSNKKSDLKLRLQHIVTPMAIIDLLAILPFFLGFFIADDLLILRSLRLIRALKLTRYARSMDVLLTVLKYEATTFFSAFFILGIIIILAATGMHLIEGKVQPEAFGSIPRSLWWATVTLTTVGYGDVIPITAGGKLLGGVIAISGITMAALPAGIMASGFSAEINRRRETFQTEVYKFMQDGIISKNEQKKLDALRHKLGLSHRDARLIISEISQSSRLETLLHCPDCQSAFHINHPAGEVYIKLKKKHESQ
ncbi:MAG TPA: ion transporter [Leucothrix mucor]|uniref:Ion transporter n=1 Tax=Leucothrix mucor TaxID=45248 RepID=A0A7V2WVW2_LEUMU|nr:ion transporter [Leucothrix mucor]